MPTANLLSRLHRSISERGLGGSVSLAVNKIYRRFVPIKIPTHPFDLRHGVDTSGLLGKPLLRTGHEHDPYITAYWGTAPSLMRGALARWSELQKGTGFTPADFTFIDIGCGKGRVLMLASEVPFRHILGIELNPTLVGIAQSNLNIWKRSTHACDDISAINADALAVTLPDSPVLIYLFNPFDAPIVQLFLDRLSALALIRNQPIDLIYARPEHAHFFDLTPNMHLLCTVDVPLTSEEIAVDAFQTHTLDYRIYRLTPQAQPIR